jgi:cell division protein ZapA
VAEQTNTIDTVRLAVLAALNIADEFHLLKRNSHVGSSAIVQRAHRMARALDDVLDEDRAGAKAG